jgi:hypothetical protein
MDIFQECYHAHCGGPLAIISGTEVHELFEGEPFQPIAESSSQAGDYICCTSCGACVLEIGDGNPPPNPLPPTRHGSITFATGRGFWGRKT